ncbi:MAG: DNA alkylation repair protein [Anaerolineales bacterium]|nr:MAG: DNA alkylation repair protein [Anaerolineales bacterium]
MPSVQLGQLQQEAAQLSEHFTDPAAYLKQLERLLLSYSTPIHRQGRISGLRPVIFSFEVPPPVLKRLELEMALQASQQPAAALAVADTLWERRSYETRQLAVRMLGATPAPASEVTSRLAAWASENQEELLVTELYQRGPRTLIQNDPDGVLQFASQLLASQDHRKQVLSIGSLETLITTGSFTNLPALFTLLMPPSLDPPRKLQPFLTSVLNALAQRSPKETAYFLGQLLNSQPSVAARRMARQVLRQLPADMQATLRDLAR